MNTANTHHSRVLLAALGVLLGLLLLEVLGPFFFPRYRYGRMVSVWTDERHIFRSSPLWGHERIPRAAPYINSFGMNDREYSLEKPSGTFRILVLGDSTSERGEWIREVRRRLNREDGVRCEMLNAAVGGWNLSNYRAYLRYRGMAFSPDLVLVAFCLNDPDDGTITTTVAYEGGRDVLLNLTAGGNSDMLRYAGLPAFRHSFLFRVLVSFLSARGSAPHGRRSAAALRSIDDMQKVSGGKIAAVILPYMTPPEKYSRLTKQNYAILRAALEKKHIPYLDLVPSFRRYGEGIAGFRRHPGDEVHFNGEANHIMAGIIHDWLRPQVESALPVVAASRSRQIKTH